MGHTHGIEWSEALIRDKILGMCKSVGLKRMPTRNEIKEFYGDEALTNKISKTHGYYGWAKKLSLDIKPSDTTQGKKYERICSEMLSNMGYDVKQMTQNYPYDLLINDSVKIDVKVSSCKYTKSWQSHTFATAKKSPTCDIYILILLSGVGEI